MWEADDSDVRAPSLAHLLVRAGKGTDAERVMGLRRLRGHAGAFVLPESPAVAARSLVAFNRLRPRRVRAVRALTAHGLRIGLRSVLTTPASVHAGAGTDLLLEHLASMLHEPGLVVSGSDHGGTGFRTPVLQLFTPDGRPRGYAKIGWDPVTRGMVDTEATALDAAIRAQWSTLRVPRIAWCGRWHDLTIMVTEPMPRHVRRLTRRELPPIDPLREVAELWGAVQRNAVSTSDWWNTADATAAVAAYDGRPAISAALEEFSRTHADAELNFGAWHGDWVEWNLARFDRHVIAWDWAYAAAAVPVGFDLLQFFHLRHHNLGGIPTEAALDLAARDAAPGLNALGLDPYEQAAVAWLHRIEVALRLERARQARTVGRAAEQGIAS